jgi:hypothetical protein
MSLELLAPERRYSRLKQCGSSNNVHVQAENLRDDLSDKQ